MKRGLVLVLGLLVVVIIANILYFVLKQKENNPTPIVGTESNIRHEDISFGQ